MTNKELKDYLSGLPNDYEVKVLGFEINGLCMKEGSINLLLEDVYFEV